MSIVELKLRLKELGGKKASLLTPEERDEIESLYNMVLDKPFKRTSCRDCYKDAAIIAYNYLVRHGACAEHRNYKMKAGACIQLAFGEAEFLTEVTCTDEKARKHLAEHPDDIGLFAHYPDNWQEDCKPQEDAPKEESETKESEPIKKATKRTKKSKTA